MNNNFQIILLLTGTICLANGNDSLCSLYKGSHKKVEIHLLREAKPTEKSLKFFLQISKQNMQNAVNEYLSFRNEPYLSWGISLQCNKDTIHPYSTMTERSYEIGNDLVYLMLFDCKVDSLCKQGTFTVNNFFDIGDTLRIPMSVEIGTTPKNRATK